PTVAARRAARARRLRERDSARRGDDGRARGSRTVGGGVVPRATGVRRPLDGGRLVPDGGHRLLRPARAHPGQGPHEGSHQVGRRVDLVRRAGERLDGASGGRGGGGDRDPRREVAGATAGGRRAEGGRHGDRGRVAVVPRAAVREVVAPGPNRVRGRDPEDGGREVQEDGAARTVRDPAGSDG